MKIATQNLILIVPIFLLLALITSLLLFFSERSEVQWGLESEAQGLALSIAEFTDPAAVAAVASGKASAADVEALRAPLERILKFGQARRIAVLDLSSGSVRAAADLGERAGTPASPDDETLLRAAKGEVVVGDAEGDRGRLIAYAPVRDASGVMRAVAAVETSAAPVAEHRAAVVRRTAIVVLALLVVGCLVSLGISKLIAGEIGRLTRAAKAFAAGDYDARLAPGPVEEVAVVGSTFGIMGSVLKDATLRSTREMLQFERFNTEANLSEQYAGRFAAPVEIAQAGLSLAIDRLGPAMHGDFWFVRTDGPHNYACLGRVDRPASFDAVLAASAAGTLLQDALSRGQSAAAALGQAGELFPLHCCVLLEWSAAGGPLTLHRLRSGEPLTRSALDPRPGRTVALTTLDGESDRKAARYADAYAFDTPRSCVEELRRFFGDGTPGGVLALQVTSS